MVWCSFVTVAGWSQHTSPSAGSTRSLGHVRSLSTFASPSAPARPGATKGHHFRSPSLSEIHKMSADVTPARLGVSQPQPQGTPASMSSQTFDEELDLSTLPDPRSRAMSPANGHGFPGSPNHHPDLNDEVATLSTKLINAINHQTTLDDTLSAAKMELDEAKATIRGLEERIAEQREMLAGDVWVRRKSVEAEKTKLLSRVAEEKRAKQEVEQQKKKIELELENLTAALFEEANKMVISAKEEARREQEALQRKNDLLRSQLADTEGLLKSQHDQLAELKAVMEQMSAERDDQTAMTAPSSPGFSKFDSKDEFTPLSEGASQAGLLEPISPSYPTSFTHLVQPILRTDLAQYEDFMTLVRTTKRLSIRSRPPSGTQNMIAMSALGLSLGHSMTASNASTISVISANGGATPSSAGSLPQTPNTPSSLGAGGPAPAAAVPPLKDSKFYKRVLVEDIEPTLRLDIAPGLSWLARRAVINAMADGSLVVEPVPPATPGSLTAIARPQFFPCALCGENRKEEEHLRTYRFRTSDTDSAQRYPLCRSYCLVRVRSACDFLGFLRLLQSGHWRADDEDAERAAWEESVRLREQMFWARIGGGVVPTSMTQNHQGSHGGGGLGRSPSLRDKSPRASQEGRRVVSGGSNTPSVDVFSSEESDKTTVPLVDEAPAAAAKPEETAVEAPPTTNDKPQPSEEESQATSARPVTPTSGKADQPVDSAAVAVTATDDDQQLSLQIPSQTA